MAKRFTDTDKWKKRFIKDLPVEYKIFWLYLLDECNHAGIWHVEFELVQIRLGITLSEKKALGLFNVGDDARVVVFDNGNKWFVPGFIEFQYGELAENNRAHKSVIESLSKYDLMKFLKNDKEKEKVHSSPLQGGKDKDKEQLGSLEFKEGGVGETKPETPPLENPPDIKPEPVGSERAQKAAHESWRDEGWRNNICMAQSLNVDELQKWMAAFNASISNDVIHEFDSRAYRKMFGGWLSRQKSKGYALTNGNSFSDMDKLRKWK